MKNSKVAMLGVVAIAMISVVNDAEAFGRRRPIPTPPLDVSIDQIQMSGTGCADNSGIAEVSEDRTTIRMSSPLAAAVDSSRRLDRKACAAVITISKIPAGKRLVVSEVKLEGAQDLGAGAVGKLSHETFLVGEVNPALELELGSMEQDTVDAISLAQIEATATACGTESALLRTNTSLLLRNAAQARDSHVALGLVQLKLRLEDCSAE